MKILFTLFLFLFSYSSQANDVQIIELHKNKSLEDLANEEPSFKDSSKTSSISDSVSAVSFSRRLITLPTKKALAMAPNIKINIETIISVTPIPNKP